MKKSLFALIALTVISVTNVSFANEDSGLYDPAPPPGSVFVRFAGDMNANGSKEIKANGKRYDYVDYAEVTPYYTLAKGNIDITVGDAKTTLKAEDGGFYTVVYKGASIENFTDTASQNMAKSQVVLYNLGEKDGVSVKTADGKIEVVSATAKGKSSLREMNPVKVSLTVYEGDKKLKDLGEVSLERGKTYNVFLFDDGNVSWVASETNTSR